MGFALEMSDLGHEMIPLCNSFISVCDIEETDKIASEDFKYFNLSEVLFYLFERMREIERNQSICWFITRKGQSS